MSTIQEQEPTPAAARGRPWRRRPWVLPLAMVVATFVAFSLPPYATLDPQQSRIQPPAGAVWYYPVLVAHVGLGTVAMLTSCVQVWPWFRQRFRAAHRRIGRVYVFGGVLPGGVTGLAIGLAGPLGPTLAVSNTILATLWLGFTFMALHRAREHRFAEHRRWMVRSVALTMSIITNRVTGFVWVLVLLPELPTTYAGSMDALLRTASSMAAWTGWMGSLLVAEWWLGRGTRRPARRVPPALSGARPHASG